MPVSQCLQQLTLGHSVQTLVVALYAADAAPEEIDAPRCMLRVVYAEAADGPCQIEGLLRRDLEHAGGMNETYINNMLLPISHVHQCSM